MKQLNFYKLSESFMEQYIKIQFDLFYNPLYAKTLSLGAKILYAFLVDRLSLSIKNNWCDENNNVYIIFTREEASQILNVKTKTATKFFKELSDNKLIAEKRQGMGKPNLIFVAKLTPSNMTCKNYTSIYANFTSLDMSNLPTIKTNNINTNISNLHDDNYISLEEIKLQAKLNEFEDDNKIILENILNTLYNSNTIKINGILLSHTEITKKLKLINKDNLIHLTDIIKKGKNIKNLNNYLITTLYNNLGNTYKKDSNNINSRNYSKDFLEGLYDTN